MIRAFLAALLPAIAHAQAIATQPAVKSFAENKNRPKTDHENQEIYLLYLIAFLVFLWGIVKYFFMNRSDEARQQGRQFMLWGLIGLVALFGVWGIVKILIGVLTQWK